MRFVSTRGGEGAASLGEAARLGWAPDGGMLLPERIPEAPLGRWRGLAYPALVLEVLALFAAGDDDALDRPLLAAAVEKAFRKELWPPPEVVPVVKTRLAAGQVVHVSELFHGPSLAFKDLGMQVLVNALSLMLAKRDEWLTLLVGTSGDTGSSAIEATAGDPRLDIAVLYPKQGFAAISPRQEYQICKRATEPNVLVLAAEGNSDDLDVPIEAAFADAAFRRKARLGSVNSVNILRVLTQTAHIVWTYLRCSETDSDEVRFFVPTGAAGHLTSCILARKMGVNLRATACTNANEILVEFVEQGRLRARDAVLSTLSPSMDIAVPYNIERVLHLVSGGDAGLVRRWMHDFKAGKELELGPDLHGALRGAFGVAATKTTDAEVLAAIRAYFLDAAPPILLDPHTAVAAHAAKQALEGSDGLGGAAACVVMACAHPAKFPETIVKAVAPAFASWAEVAAKAYGGQGNVNPNQAVEDLEAHVGGKGGGFDAAPGVVTLARGTDWTAGLQAVLEQAFPRISAWKAPAEA